MPAPDYDCPLFAHWRENTPAWSGYVDHAFVQGLGDGSLPRAAFLTYLVQDYIFLVHFARAWALGVVKADDLNEMRACAATVDALINEEMKLHVATCAEAGISEADLQDAGEHPANAAYTRYVIDAGLSGDFLDLLAALAPCVFGYGEIGRRLGAEATSDAYADWIETYSGADYQDVCRAVAGLINDAADRRGLAADDRSPRGQRLFDHFATATRLEIGFWDMGLAAGDAG